MTDGAAACPDCGSEVAPGLLSCPGCRRLVHGEELKAKAAEAARAEAAGDLATALGAWRRVLELLPRDSRQHQVVTASADALSRRIERGGGGKGARRPRWNPATDALGIGGLLILGLTKGATFLSMLLTLGVYWKLWGWSFAAGAVLSIYIHEMGHIASMRRFGIRTSVPMFIPGLGAFIRLDQYPINAREDSRIGLAGPVWGMGAALAAALAYALTGAPYWAGLAHFGGFINLFNLLPFWQLDGGRGFRSLSRLQRGLATAAIGGALALTGEELLWLLLVMAGARVVERDAPREHDWPGFAQYLLLIAVLSALTLLPVGTAA